MIKTRLFRADGLTGCVVLAVLVLGGCDDEADVGCDHPHTGTYTGRVAATFTTPGMPEMTRHYAITIEVDHNGVARVISDHKDSFASGSLTGDRFSIIDRNVADSFGGITCVGTQTFAGSIKRSFLRGDVSARFACNGDPNGPITITADGVMTAVAVSFTSGIVPFGEWEQGKLKAMRRLLNETKPVDISRYSNRSDPRA